MVPPTAAGRRVGGSGRQHAREAPDDRCRPGWCRAGGKWGRATILNGARPGWAHTAHTSRPSGSPASIRSRNAGVAVAGILDSAGTAGDRSGIAGIAAQLFVANTVARDRQHALGGRARLAIEDAGAVLE
jgi:hypothetical protein